MRRNSIVFIALTSLAAIATPALAAIPGTTATFDAGSDDFVGSTIATTQLHQAAGGNPGGFVIIRKELSSGFDAGTQNSVWPGFLGDYAAAGISGAGFDLNVFNTTLDASHLRFRRNVGENGWYYDFGAISPDGNQWASYNVSFNPSWDDATALANGWAQEPSSPSFADLMASVGWIEVRAINDESLIVGVDNVRLVPEPASLALLGLGLAAFARRRS